MAQSEVSEEGVMRAQRVAGYLTSRENLVGSGLGLLAVALALIDPVGPAGLLLVAGFYGLGVASVRRNAGSDRYGFNPRQLGKALQRKIAESSGLLPPQATAQLHRMELIFRAAVLCGIDCLPAGSLDLYLIERTASDYIPTAIDNYLRLSAALISSGGSAAAWTPLEVLNDELRLLEAQLRRIAQVVQEAQLERALAHRRFLNDRFSGINASH
jgi:hypothetical protein